MYFMFQHSRHLTIQSIIYFMILIFSIIFSATVVFAAHPLITDDTGTQGMRNFQIEIHGEYSKDNGDKELEFTSILCIGIRDNTDIAISIPYLILNPEEGAREDGLGDITLEIKWRIYERDDISIALKPGITLDTGDENRGLGDGEPSYSIVFIGTNEINDYVAMYLNIGYTKNRKELRNMWQYSFAGEYSLTESLKIVGDIGGETNPDRSSHIHPLFLLGGIVYNINEDFDIDFGIKTGLNKTEVDYAILTGIALRF